MPSANACDRDLAEVDLGHGHEPLKALYRTTLSAGQRNPWLRVYYQRLKKNGKLPKVAPSLMGGPSSG
jgi:hypothetical protein